jgi:hypothetical protein
MINKINNCSDLGFKLTNLIFIVITFAILVIDYNEKIFFVFQNLPFDVQSKYKFTLYTALFFSSGFGLPFLMVRYVKKRSG